MSLEPIVSAVEIRSQRSASEVRDATADAILGIKGARRGAAGWLQFRLGSATWLRVWGLWAPRAYTHLPLMVDASVTDLRTERRLRLEFRSDEGPYLFRVNRAEPAYRRRFAEVEAAVRERLV